MTTLSAIAAPSSTKLQNGANFVQADKENIALAAQTLFKVNSNPLPLTSRLVDPLTASAPLSPSFDDEPLFSPPSTVSSTSASTISISSSSDVTEDSTEDAMEDSQDSLASLSPTPEKPRKTPSFFTFSSIDRELSSLDSVLTMSRQMTVYQNPAPAYPLSPPSLPIKLESPAPINIQAANESLGGEMVEPVMPRLSHTSFIPFFTFSQDVINLSANQEFPSISRVVSYHLTSKGEVAKPQINYYDDELFPQASKDIILLRNAHAKNTQNVHKVAVQNIRKDLRRRFFQKLRQTPADRIPLPKPQPGTKRQPGIDTPQARLSNLGMIVVTNRAIAQSVIESYGSDRGKEDLV